MISAEGKNTSSPSSSPSRKVDALDLTFMNHNAAYKSKTTKEVLRAYTVFQLCSITPLVANNEKVNFFNQIQFSLTSNPVTQWPVFCLFMIKKLKILILS